MGTFKNSKKDGRVGDTHITTVLPFRSISRFGKTFMRSGLDRTLKTERIATMNETTMIFAIVG